MTVPSPQSQIFQHKRIRLVSTSVTISTSSVYHGRHQTWQVIAGSFPTSSTTLALLTVQGGILISGTILSEYVL